SVIFYYIFFFFQAEDGIRDRNVTGVQTCALPIFHIYKYYDKTIRIKEGKLMDFNLSKEQEMTRNMARDFSLNVIRPQAIDIDKEARIPVDIMNQMGELGLLGSPFPEKYGGSGGDTVSYALADEEIAKACGSTGLSYAAAVSLGASPIYFFGTEEQKEKFLTPLASGKELGAFGLTEPNAGSDAGGTQTTATEDGNDYIISGEKCFITNAS